MASEKTINDPIPEDVESENEEGWEDAEPDNEEESPVVCLFCPNTFPAPNKLFEHCGESHGFDFVKTKEELELDFYGTIKLVNYIRSETKASRVPDFTSRAFLDDDKFLQPVLEDDTLLFSLDDPELDLGTEEKGATTNADKVKELELRLASLSQQFLEYKNAVNKSFEAQLAEPDKDEVKRDDDSHYFHSYAGNDIHETMLKDTVRTDAYRDFIYENKHLFKDKVVLDVGCGTGVLSMFCAKAGAKKVIAVDNSAIIDKARENVFENSLDGIITCLHGKIEEVVLPVKQVDIIVSEWMGYLLLYEAMLDSVLYARDKYLAPDGLMVPSECKLLIAAMHDSEYINENVNFWNHVYGFSMSAMKEKIREDVIVHSLEPKSLASEPVVFYNLPLHTIKTSELSFTNKFSLSVKDNIESLDAFVIYFDTFFTTSRGEYIPENARAETWKATKDKGVAFTTGPFKTPTHWRQGVLLVENKSGMLKSGENIEGEITYRKSNKNSREVEVDISWKTDEKKDQQLWYMR
ncbi:S-adenosyl-L-methionine-dependent methyltransferase [Morchella conica CCBAS932]|uniref:type I protein arginine methyltransferase n=1 Tax=Morchella conica CCBAS932 TaxID=1392247 RepID=A0A3N4KYQ1_9PEZI|nr:S-adenosyl-L-methionine-dependent methyltransferase [Morchella conica CCBAS932]